tara:strand:- start:2709 stop:2900 length:192 start_codon:yes stop_codon:yes gene_type:complete
MSSIIAQLTKELNNKYSKYELFKIIEEVMEREISNTVWGYKDRMLGVRIMAKALHDELEQRGD